MAGCPWSAGDVRLGLPRRQADDRVRCARVVDADVVRRRLRGERRRQGSHRETHRDSLHERHLHSAAGIRLESPGGSPVFAANVASPPVRRVSEREAPAYSVRMKSLLSRVTRRTGIAESAAVVRPSRPRGGALMFRLPARGALSWADLPTLTRQGLADINASVAWSGPGPTSGSHSRRLPRSSRRKDAAIWEIVWTYRTRRGRGQRGGADPAPRAARQHAEQDRAAGSEWPTDVVCEWPADLCGVVMWGSHRVILIESGQELERGDVTRWLHHGVSTCLAGCLSSCRGESGSAAGDAAHVSSTRSRTRTRTRSAVRRTARAATSG